MGYTVSIPLTDSQDYDLIFEDERGLQKVQIKTTSYQVRKNVYGINLSIKGGNRSSIGKLKKFDGSNVDYLFVLTENGVQYLVPTKEVKAKYSMNTTKNMDKYIVKLK